MKKIFKGIILGVILALPTYAIASKAIDVNPNRFPILVDGVESEVDAYNINGRTYLQLNDISKLTGLNVEFKDNKIHINVNSTTKGSTSTGDYSSVPSFEEMSGLKAKDIEKKSEFNKIKYEYDSKDAKKLAQDYMKLLETNGFVRVKGLDDDLDFDDFDNDDDFVYRKGDIFVSIDFDDDDIEIKMATNPNYDKKNSSTNEKTDGQYSSVPSFEEMSGIKPSKIENKSEFNKIKYEYDSKDAKKLAQDYMKLLETNGFVRVKGLDDDLDFDDFDNDDDIVYRKGDIFVSIDYDDDDIKIKMATNPNYK